MGPSCERVRVVLKKLLARSRGLVSFIYMTAFQKTIIVMVVVAAIVVAIFQAREVANLREQVRTFRQQQGQESVLSNQVQQLQRERDDARQRLAAFSSPSEPQKKNPNEVLKLRGEVGRLRQENADIGSSSGLSKVTANPEARKMLRNQQRLGMSMIYKGFTEQAKLTSEQTDKLNDLLADNIMDNVDHVTKVLRDKPTPEKMNELFASQEAAFQAKLQDVLGQDSLAQYQDYTKNLLSTLTTEQFKGKLSGADTVKDEKSKQLNQAMKEETLAVLTNAGLPADYQTVPMLNFRNIASEQEGEKSLKLIEDIYQRVATRANAFLSPEELEKFQIFRNLAVNNNRSALTLNRTMMAPISN